MSWRWAHSWLRGWSDQRAGKYAVPSVARDEDAYLRGYAAAAASKRW